MGNIDTGSAKLPVEKVLEIHSQIWTIITASGDIYGGSLLGVIRSGSMIFNSE